MFEEGLYLLALINTAHPVLSGAQPTNTRLVTLSFPDPLSTEGFEACVSVAEGIRSKVDGTTIDASVLFFWHENDEWHNQVLDAVWPLESWDELRSVTGKQDL